MEWIAEPTAWLGLATLVVLEIVLGIDNLIFIAILADKLPPAERDKARIIGLTLAMLMRLVLLASISWLATLTDSPETTMQRMLWLGVLQSATSGLLRRRRVLIGIAGGGWSC